jgi:hypothetical protein
MNMLVQQYQQRVLTPEEPVDYSSIVIQSYPPQALHQEPFIGFKVLCTDTQAFNYHPSERIRYIDANLGFIRNKGVIVRETNSNKPDGLWVITLPVPRSQVSTALNNLFDVLASFAQYLGIVRDGLFEINVSGKCHVTEVERCFSSLSIPQRYMSNLIPSGNVMCSMGQIQRINDNFMCLRTIWNLSNTGGNGQSNFEDLTVLSQLLASMYHN